MSEGRGGGDAKRQRHNGTQLKLGRMNGEGLRKERRSD